MATMLQMAPGSQTSVIASATLRALSVQKLSLYENEKKFRGLEAECENKMAVSVKIQATVSNQCFSVI